MIIHNKRVTLIKFPQVIVLERNRRVAKAYARAPVVTVNGSEEGFDGFRIGKKITMIMNLQNF